MKKKLQLIALSILLVAVIVGGVWLLTRSPGEKAPDTSDDPAISQTEVPGQPVDTTNKILMQYHTIRQETRNTPYWGGTLYKEIFFYQGQPCIIDSTFSDDMMQEDLQIISLVTGEVLKDYGMQDAARGYLILDNHGTLWRFWQEGKQDGDDYRRIIASCGDGYQPEEFQVLPLHSTSIVWARCRPFIIWDGRLFTQTVDDRGVIFLEIINLETMESEALLEVNNGRYFCLDGEGLLYYYIQGEGDPDNGIDVSLELAVYSPEEKRELFRVDVGNGNPFYTFGALTGLEKGCLLRSADMEDIYRLDPETRAVTEFVLVQWDVDTPTAGIRDGDNTAFVMDESGCLYFLESVEHKESENEEDWYLERKATVLEPEYREIDPERAVTLTITSPYVVESLDQSIHWYLRKHPEVTIQWDSPYSSRDAFIQDSLVYSEQLAVRTIAGDIGDLVMTNGAGLDEDMIRDTDAFADLTGYLEDCDFRDQLPMEPLETLRGADGAVRSVPIAITPNLYAWNAGLASQQSIDPDNVTWLELLKLAKTWKDQDSDWSLCAGEDRSYLEDNLLLHMLLANLYDAEKEDGTVQLDQPYLRELLELWKELQGSNQLSRTDGDLSKALFRFFTARRAFFVDLGEFHDWERESGCQLRLSGPPKGESNKLPQGYAFCWGISNRSEHKDAAWELLQFFISANGLPDNQYLPESLPWNTEAQSRWYQYQLTHQLDGKDRSRLDRGFQEVQQVLCQPYARFSEKYGWDPAVFEPISQYLNDQISLDQAMSQASDNWARLLLE